MAAACTGWAALRSDPSGTKSLRNKYAAKLRGRYAAIARDIRTAVKDDDIFGLDSDALATPDRNFEFETDERKIALFNDWLREELENGPLELANETENRYIRNAYVRGVKDANAEIGAEVDGDVDVEEMVMGTREEKLQQLYTRNFRALQDINDEMAAQISETLTKGLADGIHPNEMARNLTDRVDTVGKTRATVMARTEVLHAHAESKLDTYQDGNISEVVGQAEISTAQDSRVCDQCATHHGKRYTIEKARGILPFHPQCRCVFKPVTDASGEPAEFYDQSRLT